MSFLDKVKKAGKSVVDAGAKTMLKVRLDKVQFMFASVFTKFAELWDCLFSGFFQFHQSMEERRQTILENITTQAFWIHVSITEYGQSLIVLLPMTMVLPPSLDLVVCNFGFVTQIFNH